MWSLGILMMAILTGDALLAATDKHGAIPLPNLDGLDPEEMKECINLLKAMLRFDAQERIIPSQVLSHPFIRRGNLQMSSVENTEKSQAEEPLRQPDQEPQPSGPSLSSVHPAQTVCGLSQVENVELSCSHTTELYEPPQRCVQTILVQPAPPESSLELDEDTEDNFHRLTGQLSPALSSEESSASSDTDLEDVKPSKTRKKKNVFTRFWRWVRKKVLCCSNVIDHQD